MLLVRIIENKQLMLIFGQVRLSRGHLCPAALRKRLCKCPVGLEPPAGARLGKTTLQLIFNDLRSSILPGSAPDQKLLMLCYP